MCRGNTNQVMHNIGYKLGRKLQYSTTKIRDTPASIAQRAGHLHHKGYDN